MYAVELVHEDQLPEGHDWLLIRDGEDAVAFVDHEAVRPWMLEDAWSAYQRGSVLVA